MFHWQSEHRQVTSRNLIDTRTWSSCCNTAEWRRWFIESCAGEALHDRCARSITRFARAILLIGNGRTNALSRRYLPTVVIVFSVFILSWFIATRVNTKISENFRLRKASCSKHLNWSNAKKKGFARQPENSATRSKRYVKEWPVRHGVSSSETKASVPIPRYPIRDSCKFYELRDYGIVNYNPGDSSSNSKNSNSFSSRASSFTGMFSSLVPLFRIFFFFFSISPN